MEGFRAFTLKYPITANMLKTDALIMSSVRNNSRPYTPKLWKGLWDTGASRSSINQKIVDDLSLIPIGKTSICTANGIIIANTFFVDIGLPNGVMVNNVLVSCSDLGNDIDVLIGMDIIGHGDFSITNVNNKTTFTFRTPSVREIDYVKEANNSPD